MAVKPAITVSASDLAPQEAFTFQVSSQRGADPALRPNERLELLFRTGEDAWIYCFYTDSKGTTIQILPNAFQGNFSNANFYTGATVHLFPDAERRPIPDPFDLIINEETTGIEFILCVATRENVTADLPTALQGLSFDPVPSLYSIQLHEIFKEASKGALATASMTITVLQ